jgi:hypothetical protein
MAMSSIMIMTAKGMKATMVRQIVLQKVELPHEAGAAIS